MSLTAASVKVADARQYLASGNAAANHCQRSWLKKLIGVMTMGLKQSILPIWQESSPTLLHITVDNLKVGALTMDILCDKAIVVLGSISPYLSLVNTDDANGQAAKNLLHPLFGNPRDGGSDHNRLD